MMRENVPGDTLFIWPLLDTTYEISIGVSALDRSTGYRTAGVTARTRDVRVPPGVSTTKKKDDEIKRDETNRDVRPDKSWDRRRLTRNSHVVAGRGGTAYAPRRAAGLLRRLSGSQD